MSVESAIVNQFNSNTGIGLSAGKERRGSINSWGGRTVDYGRRRRLTLGPGLIVPTAADFSVPYYYGLVSELYLLFFYLKARLIYTFS